MLRTLVRLRDRKDLIIDSARRDKALPDLVFDGRFWEVNGTPNWCRLHQIGEKTVGLNKAGQYLLWNLPSDKKHQHRRRPTLVGLVWKKDGSREMFFAEIELHDAER